MPPLLVVLKNYFNATEKPTKQHPLVPLALLDLHSLLHFSFFLRNKLIHPQHKYGQFIFVKVWKSSSVEEE